MTSGFVNWDIESLVHDKERQEILLFNSGDGKSYGKEVDGLKPSAAKIVRFRLSEQMVHEARSPVRSESFEIELQLSEMNQKQIRNDFEGAILTRGVLAFVEKPLHPLMTGDPRLVVVAMGEVRGGRAKAKAQGTLGFYYSNPVDSRVRGDAIDDWVTDAEMQKKPDGSFMLTVLGYNGVYQCSVSALDVKRFESGESSILCQSGFEDLVVFAKRFVPYATPQAEALVMTGEREGLIIKESGKDRNGNSISSPAFRFRGRRFVEDDAAGVGVLAPSHSIR